MSYNSSNKPDKTPVNHHLKSSIVHKPFATGTINIFNPYKSRDKDNSETTSSKLLVDSELEPEEFRQQLRAKIGNKKTVDDHPNWLNSLLSPWGIIAIAILFLSNFISAGVIWRNWHLSQKSDMAKSSLSTVSNVDLTNKEFIPLNLGTLSMIKIEQTQQELKPKLTPINPALAPLDNLTASSVIDPQYYYVLTEYAGEESLSSARQKVKQISLVNLPQGVFIYLGAFTEKQQAQEFVAQLKLENFPAYVYPLD